MTKSRKIVVALIVAITALLLIFFLKDYIIRKYFISKLENVDYDEYILELSLNNKKSAIYYYTPEFVMECTYNDSGELSDCIITKDYVRDMEHYYYTTNNETISIPIDLKSNRPQYINNEILLDLLNKGNKCKYKGTQVINNKKCYIFEFEDEQEIITTIYLNQKLLYTSKIDTYTPSNKTNKDKHVISEYVLDLNLTKKYLFEF